MKIKYFLFQNRGSGHGLIKRSTRHGNPSVHSLNKFTVLGNKSTTPYCLFVPWGNTIRCSFCTCRMYFYGTVATSYQLQGPRFPSWNLQFPSTSPNHASHSKFACVCVCLQCPLMNLHSIQDIYMLCTQYSPEGFGSTMTLTLIKSE